MTQWAAFLLEGGAEIASHVIVGPWRTMERAQAFVDEFCNTHEDWSGTVTALERPTDAWLRLRQEVDG